MNHSDATPLMRQYFQIKEQYPDMILLFQVGDFYELFFDDAKIVAACVGIALTKRGYHNSEPIPLCGVPVHALDHYLTKLIKAGHKIAICDQLEVAKPGKIVQRGITKVLTPGTLTDTKLLDEKSASYLFSLAPLQNQWGLLFAELLTAQLYATIIPADAHKTLESELIRFFPDEILIPSSKEADSAAQLCKKCGYFVTRVAACEDPNDASHWMEKQFNTSTLSELQRSAALQQSFSHFHSYLKHTNQSALEQFKAVHFYESNDFLILDKATQINLELVNSMHDGKQVHTLFETIDGSSTPMGSRMIKKWIMRPLIKKTAIEQRLDAVEAVVKDLQLQMEMQKILKEIGDIERVIGRIALYRAPLHDYLMLANALNKMEPLKLLLQNKNVGLLNSLTLFLQNFQTLYDLLKSSLNDDFNKDWIIKSGFNQQLDHIRQLIDTAQEKILELERQEQQATGIGSLKIRYNGVQGYYIEVTKTHMDAIPAYYTRLQTLAGKERYMTIALQQLQQEIMQARADIETVEKTIFDHVKREVATYIAQLRKMAHALAHLDALTGLAKVAYDQGYARPSFHENKDILITKGRHPIVEKVLQHHFIANDTALTDEQSTWIVTGPNMGGKSTYLRQVALLCIMAQIGSFIPAQSVQLPILDRVFTRIGAGDQLAQGKSTFLVEMEETATICNQATQSSLVILDEIGRGTSTYDGLAIAHAVLEFLHTQVKARCLFATHYHELVAMEQKMAGLVSYYMASRKSAQGIIFLYKIVKGCADGSFGIEVAKLAQLPLSVVARAQELLHEFDSQIPKPAFAPAKSINLVNEKSNQYDHIIAQLQEIDFDALSPKQAFDLLWAIREQL